MENNLKYSYMTNMWGLVVPFPETNDWDEWYVGDYSNSVYYLDWDKILKFHVGAGITGIENDIGFVVNDLFYFAHADIEKISNTRRKTLEVPYMRHRYGEFYMTHPIATNTRLGHFDAASVADDSPITYPFILSALTLPVLYRTEDAFAEEPVALRFKRAVIDRFRLGNFTVRPIADFLGGCELNANCIEIRGLT